LLFEVATSKAINGDMRALQTLMKLAERYEVPLSDDRPVGGCFVLPMKPETPEEWQRIYGEAAKGAPIPQEILDRVNKMTRRTH
jgi:hypothetical protein